LRRTSISAHTLGLAAIITASVLWGASFFFGKIALQELAPTQLVLWRFALAVGILGPLAFVQAARRRVPAGRPRLWSRPRLADVPLFVMTGLVMVPLQIVLQFEALARTTASSASLLVGALAPMLALAAVLVAGERLWRAGWGAVVCSAVGVVVMAGRP